MSPLILDWLSRGATQAAYWQMAVYFLVMVQLTIFTTTLYLHRSATHRGVDFHPVLTHFFRFWSWLTTAMVTKEWVGVHRKHHAKCETEEDPHSPRFYGINQVLWRGVELYRTRAWTRRCWRSTARARPTTGSSATSTRRARPWVRC